jgi:3-oxoadipate enol-lactonase
LVNDLEVSYNDNRLEGVPVIIFIHGFPFNKSMWNKQMDELIAYFLVISYDIRGHGIPDKGDDDFSIELFARDLISVMVR